jgi:mRNA-degrading endonuclease RelE of RelBE toxin-antitoxin system
MNYHLIYTAKAVGQLDGLPPEFVDLVEANLQLLAENPAANSVPIASPPFPPRGQLFYFLTSDWRGEQWFFTVIFQYSQDETSLHILSVTWRELIDE